MRPMHPVLQGLAAAWCLFLWGRLWGLGWFGTLMLAAVVIPVWRFLVPRWCDDSAATYRQLLIGSRACRRYLWQFESRRRLDPIEKDTPPRKSSWHWN